MRLHKNLRSFIFVAPALIILLVLFQNATSPSAALKYEDKSCLDNDRQSCRYYYIPEPRGRNTLDHALNDGPIIQAYLDDGSSFSKSHLQTKVVFEFPSDSTRKNYFLLGNPKRRDELHILSGNNLIIDAKGANFFIPPSSTFLFVGNCTNCEFKNFTYDNLQLPFTQGEVIATNLVNNTVDLHVHAGYPLRSYTQADIDTSAIGKHDSLAIIFQTKRLNTRGENLEYPNTL